MHDMPCSAYLKAPAALSFALPIASGCTCACRRTVACAGRSDPRYSYLLDFPGLEGVAVSTKVPPEEYFSLTYIRERMLATVSLLYNGIVSRIVLEVNRSANDNLDDLDDFAKYFPPFQFKLLGFVPLPIPLPDADKFIQLPEVATRLEDESYYGEQRLAGLNPGMLRGLNSADPRTSTLLAAVPGAADAISAGEMFVLDYTGRSVGDGLPDWVLPDKPIKGGEYEFEGKTYHKALPLPLGFFQWEDGSDGKRGRLWAVAIQLHESGRIYTPADARYDWLMAKIALGIADSNHHEMVSHLGKTHLFTEAFAVATRRCFNDDHPLSYLLCAHTRFMIANNCLARDILIGKGGYVDRLLAGYIEESAELARLAVLNTHFLEDNFVNDLAKRDVSPDRLPYYPYRDDGQLLWDAIWDFATEYVAACYASDEELQEDKEVQRWCQELADPNQGAVNGMKAKVDTAEELVEILTTLIFISGPGHSAERCTVNYTQHPLGGYVPNLPLAARDPYRELSRRPASEPITEKDFLAMLPNQRNNRDQTEVLFVLSAYRFEYDKTFDSLYELTTAELLADHPQGAGLQKAIQNFQAALAKAEEKIRDENLKDRNVPYDFMAPSVVLNSISI